MSATVYGKWYWSDWMADPSVRASSYAARGLWMDLLCLAAMADPTGYVVLNGRPLTASDIARLTGGDASEVETLLDELERNGVFTRDRHGRIYSRRMVREIRNAEKNRKNGKLGGNPSLRKQRENPDPDNPPDKRGDKTQKPEARSQKPASSRERDLRAELARAFKELAPQRSCPDTSHAAVWLARGHPPELIVAVVREVLARKHDVASLNYFDARLDEEASRPSSKPALHTAVKPPATPEQDRRNRLAKATAHFRGEWRQGWPDEFLPGHPACTTPADVIAEARSAVDREGRASGEASALSAA